MEDVETNSLEYSWPPSKDEVPEDLPLLCYEEAVNGYIGTRCLGSRGLPKRDNSTLVLNIHNVRSYSWNLANAGKAQWRNLISFPMMVAKGR